MDGKDRVRRHDARRGQPIRNATHHLGMGEASAQEPRQPDGAAPSFDKIVSDAVGLGYQVIDEQIRQGRAAAERLRAGDCPLDVPPSDASALIERTIELSKGLAATWLDLLSALGTAVQQARPTQAGPSRPPSTAGTPRSPSIMTITDYEVKCNRQAEVSIHLHTVSTGFIPAVLPLHAADPAIRPLSDVFITPSQDKRRPMLNIPVPDGQQPGTYSGAIVDAATNEPGGMLIVRILS